MGGGGGRENGFGDRRKTKSMTSIGASLIPDFSDRRVTTFRCLS